MIASVTSAIDKSIDNNDNNEKKREAIFFVSYPGDQKARGILKCFQTSC